MTTRLHHQETAAASIRSAAAFQSRPFSEEEPQSHHESHAGQLQGHSFGTMPVHGKPALALQAKQDGYVEEQAPVEGDLSQQIESACSGGSGLAPDVQRQLEGSLGTSLGQVRIHADPEADRLARSVSAKAFTTGQDIFFRAGAYDPSSPEGLHLLAHEVTHTVQQASGPVDGNATEGGVSISDPGDRFEQAAEQVAHDVVAGLANPASQSASTASTATPVQTELDTPIQREDETTPDFDISLLPPEMRLRLGDFSLSADTGDAQLGYRSGPFGARLGYEYGGNISAGMSYRDFSARFGVNPGSGDLSLGGSYDQFRFGASASPGSGRFGLNLGYGSPLLPLPDQLSNSVYAGEAGMRGILSGLPGGLSDPIGFYRSQSENIDAVSSAGSMLGRVASQQGSDSNFGAGVNLSYDPRLGVTLWGGLQGRF